MNGPDRRPGAPRILVLVHGRIGPRMSGPEIRGWQIALALARTHGVTVAAREPEERICDGVRIVPGDRRRLVREAFKHDAVIGPSLPPYLLLALSGKPVAVVSDQYDPVDLEVATLGPRAEVTREVAVRKAHLRLQLRFADMLLCANERQRERLYAEAGESGRGRQQPDVHILPMGIPDDPPDGSDRVLRARFPSIAEDDVVVLWWGSIWKWFDAETAIRAVAELSTRRPKLKLVITAGPPSQPKRSRMLELDAARTLARSLGVLDRQVFFVDEWVPYESRGAFLRDADIGISLHRDTPEAQLAARSRYMDYLWASLPCVLAEGDEMTREFSDAGFATAVPVQDLAATKDALLLLADDEQIRATGRAAAETLAPSHRWNAIVDRWRPSLEALVAGYDGRRSREPALLGSVAVYYGLRGADRAATAAQSLLTRKPARAS